MYTDIKEPAASTAGGLGAGNNTNYVVRSVARNQLGMRKSCDRCRRIKRKCDGSMPCSRCIEAEDQCVYSKRRSHQVSPWSKRQRNPAGRKGVRATDASQHATSGALVKQGMLPFRSQIRGAIVKMLARPAIGLPSQSVPSDRGESLDVVTLEDSLHPSLIGRELPMDPTSSVFWSAVGLGAIMRGTPIESVAHYTQLARDALEAYSGPANAEVVRAMTTLAYLYMFSGDLDMHQKYVNLSASVLRTFMGQGLADTLPKGFADFVQSSRVSFETSCDDVDKVASFLAQEQHTPHLSDDAREIELYTFVMRSWKMMEATAFSAVINSKAEETDPRLSVALAEVLDTMEERLKECSAQYMRLEEIVDRGDFRDGIGGLMINGSARNSEPGRALYFEKAKMGDISGTLERIARCVEIYERFPGLCRFGMGIHASHITLAGLSVINDPRAGELYNTLRATYNRTRLPGVPAIPPLEEWRGISQCCESLYCRAMESFISFELVRGLSIKTDTGEVHEEENASTFGTSGDVGVIDGGGRTSTFVVAQPPERPSTEARFGGREGQEGGPRDTAELAEEDWHEVVEALLDTVADP